MPGLWWSAATFLAFFTCVVLHELGHSLTAMRFGVGVRRILLMPIGGMAEFDSIPRQPRQELLITLAGPAVNFAIAALLWLRGRLPERLGATDAAPSTPGRSGPATLLAANLIMGLFNLLPAFPDGRRADPAGAAGHALPYLRATYWAATIAKVILAFRQSSLASVSRADYLLSRSSSSSYLAGEAEYRAVKRREVEEAQWREVAAATFGDTASRRAARHRRLSR